MPAPRGKTRDQRVASVRDAARDIPNLVGAAVQAEARWGGDHSETLAAWEAVEATAATIHRQARLLAGKRRGG